MLPEKIKNDLILLTKKTEFGEISWDYNYKNSLTLLKMERLKYDIAIQYHYDMDNEVGEFFVFYFDKGLDKEYSFSTNQLSEDYEIVRKLFEFAQASEVESISGIFEKLNEATE